MKLGRFRIALSSCLMIISCKTSSAPEASMQKAESTRNHDLPIGMNDVSILIPYFPIATKDRDWKKIGEIGAGLSKMAPSIISEPDPDRWASGLPRANLDGEPFVPLAYLKQMVDLQVKDAVRAQEGSSSISVPRFKNDIDFLRSTRLVGIRLDPCANKLDLKKAFEKCLPVLQLTWQSMSLSDTWVSMNDRNFHTIYWLSRAEVKDIVDTMKEMHNKAPKDTLGLPLQPNPAILEEGFNGQYMRSALGIVHRYARAGKLYGFASLATDGNDGGTQWHLAQAQIVKGSFVITPVFAVEPRTPGQRFGAFGNPRLIDTTVPNPLSTSQFKLPLITQFKAEEQSTDQKEFKAFIRNSQAIDNPLIHSATNIDCSSCHKATHSPLMETLLKDKPSNLHEYTYESTRWDLSNVSEQDISRWSLQMFSYSFSSPKISQRVINETADSLDTLVEMGFVDRPKDWDAGNKRKTFPTIDPNPSISRLALPVTPPQALRAGDRGSIRSRLTGKCLDLKDGNKAEGASFQVWDCSAGNQNQQFLVEAASDGKYVFKSLGSGLCLDARGSDRFVHQSSCEKDKSQRMSIEPSMEGYGFLRVEPEQSCIVLQGSNYGNGTLASLGSCFGHEWKFQAE